MDGKQHKHYKKIEKWVAKIKVNKKYKYIGYFKNKNDAIHAYKKKEKGIMNYADKVLQEYIKEWRSGNLAEKGYPSRGKIARFISQALEDQKQQWKEWALGCLSEEHLNDKPRAYGFRKVKWMDEGYNIAIQKTKKRIEEL